MVNDLDDKGTGSTISFSDNNMFVTYMNNDNPDENPVMGILHLK